MGYDDDLNNHTLNLKFSMQDNIIEMDPPFFTIKDISDDENARNIITCSKHIEYLCNQNTNHNCSSINNIV